MDVFFVISGYLVTGIILGDIYEKQFTILNFYQKRVLRLFPALITVLGASLIYAALTMLSPEFKNFGLHIFSGTFFFSNITLFSEAGYFDKASELKPLLHLWSLSLEEQFYLIWPFLLIVSAKYIHVLKKYGVAILILLACIISFIFSMIYTVKNPSLAFYQLPFRLWELGLGGLLAVIQGRNWINEKRFRIFFDLFAVIGLWVIFYASYKISDSMPFPGRLALAPVLGTLLVILSKDDSRGIKWVLKQRPFVYIGKISYPLYLWHWPLFSFPYVYYNGSIPTNVSMWLVGLSFVLAILTYELIEKQVAKIKSFKTFITLLVMNIILGLGGLAIFLADGVPARYPEYERRTVSKKGFSDSIKDNNKSAFCHQKEMKSVEMCMITHEELPPTLALIGDSHANHWYPGVLKKYPNENIVLLSKSGTAPFVGVKTRRTPETDMENELSYVLKNESIKTVILSGFWSNYFEEEGTLLEGDLYKNIIYSNELKSQKQADVFAVYLEKTLKALKDANKKVIFFYDTPALDFELDGCVLKPFVREKKSCLYKLSEQTKKQEGYRKAVAPILLKYNILSFDPLPAVCNTEECDVLRDEEFLFTDSHHLSIWGSQKVIDSFTN